MIEDSSLLSPIVADVKQLIEQSRHKLASAVNAELTLLYWSVGRRINQDVLGNERAGYGQQVVKSLAGQLAQAYGRGWGEKQLRQCMQLAAVFPDESIVYTVCRQLSWSHLRLVIYLDDPLKRAFYLELCIHERWSVRTFRERIQSMLYERTAISGRPEHTILRADSATRGAAAESRPGFPGSLLS